MKKTLAIAMIIALSGCAAAVSKPDEDSSIVYLSAGNRNTLLAESIDGITVYDGRYFKVAPGTHVLRVRVITEKTEGSTSTNFATFNFDDFKAKNGYRLTLKNNNINRELVLLDESGSIVKAIKL